jgi:hypothetical protein
VKPVQRNVENMGMIIVKTAQKLAADVQKLAV